MSPSIGPARVSQKPSFAVNEQLDSLQAKFEKNPESLFEVAQELLTLFPAQEGLSQPAQHQGEQGAESSHSDVLAKNLRTRICAKIGGEETFQNVCKVVKQKEEVPSLEFNKKETAQLSKFVKACLSKDGVSVHFHQFSWSRWPKLRNCIGGCFQSGGYGLVFGFLIGVISSPFVIASFLFTFFKVSFYTLFKMPSIVRDKIARTGGTQRSLAVHELLSKVLIKLESKQVTSPDLQKCIAKIIKAYKPGILGGSASSQSCLVQLSQCQRLSPALREDDPNDKTLIGGNFEKDKFYQAVKSYLLDTREGQPAGSAPKNAGKELYRILIKNLAEFVGTEAKDVGENAGSTAVPSAPLAELNGPDSASEGEEGSFPPSQRIH